LDEFVITGELDLLKLQQILNWEAQAMPIRKSWLLIYEQLLKLWVANIRLLSLNNGKLY